MSFSFSKAHTSCSVSSTKMRLGRKNLKWLAALGCDAVLNTNKDHIVAVWFGPMQGVHIVCGFIGTAADSWWTDDLGGDFADDICDGDTIAGSWVSRAYSFWTGDDSIAIAPAKIGTTPSTGVRTRTSIGATPTSLRPTGSPGNIEPKTLPRSASHG